ncbi:hypothetical protein [Streptomyces sp. NPDC046374]|uniref:hypothetical protein n=1 Tax=unclassified Streptomyces TaxID=2593676 RepID=UPI0033F8C880
MSVDGGEREQGDVRSWMKSKEKVTPTAANRDLIDSAYWTRRRENLVRSGWLKRHLDNDGRGRRVEIYPVDQSHVPAERAPDAVPALDHRPVRLGRSRRRVGRPGLEPGG